MIVFKRKQAVLVLVVCMILVAGYINWAYQGSSDTAEKVANAQVTTEKSVQNLGQAALVSAPVTTETDVISSAKQSRDTARNKAIETLKETVNNQSLDKESRDKAQSALTAIAAAGEKEGICEGLIETKVGKCAVFISEGSASISVKTDSLKDADAAKIKDIIVTHAGISADKIKINAMK